jgi:hypothetical protein
MALTDIQQPNEIDWGTIDLATAIEMQRAEAWREWLMRARLRAEVVLKEYEAARAEVESVEAHLAVIERRITKADLQ